MRDLQYMIDVITAAKAGKQLQWSNKDCIEKEWMNISPNASEWNWAKYDYRIAPEPRKAREWYAYYDDHRHEMRIQFGPIVDCEQGKYILVREVLPGEK